MSKLYEEIKTVIENEITVELLGDGIYGKRTAAKAIEKICIKAQIDLLEVEIGELCLIYVYVHQEDGKKEYTRGLTEAINRLKSKVTELQKQLER